MSSDPLNQDDIERLIAEQAAAAAGEPEAVDEPAPLAQAPAAGDGGPMSQDAIEALLAGEAPAAEAAGDALGGLSQAEIEAILSAGAGEPGPAAATEAFAEPQLTAIATVPGEPEPVIEDIEFDQLRAVEAPLDQVAGIDVLLDVPLSITVELGQATVTIRELLELAQGSILQLNRHAGEPVDVLVNGQRLARGEVVVIDEDFGIRLTDVVSQAERLRTMGS